MTKDEEDMKNKQQRTNKLGRSRGTKRFLAMITSAIVLSISYIAISVSKSSSNSSSHQQLRDNNLSTNDHHHHLHQPPQRSTTSSSRRQLLREDAEAADIHDDDNERRRKMSTVTTTKLRVAPMPMIADGKGGGKKHMKQQRNLGRGVGAQRHHYTKSSKLGKVSYDAYGWNSNSNSNSNWNNVEEYWHSPTTMTNNHDTGSGGGEETTPSPTITSNSRFYTGDNEEEEDDDDDDYNEGGDADDHDDVLSRFNRFHANANKRDSHTSTTTTTTTTEEDANANAIVGLDENMNQVEVIVRDDGEEDLYERPVELPFPPTPPSPLEQHQETQPSQWGHAQWGHYSTTSTTNGWMHEQEDYIECYPVEQVLWGSSGGGWRRRNKRRLASSSSNYGYWNTPPPPQTQHYPPQPSSWGWVGGAKASKTIRYGWYPSYDTDTKSGKKSWYGGGTSSWNDIQSPHHPPHPMPKAPVIDHDNGMMTTMEPPPPPPSWHADPWLLQRSAKAHKSGKTKSGKSCYILQGIKPDDNNGPMYCGMSFADAATQCAELCMSDGDCSGGQGCFGPITSCGPNYCGMSFSDAESQCSTLCQTDGDCSGGESCFGPITSCDGPPQPPVDYGYCGVDAVSASLQCSTQCVTNADCSGGGEQCFSSPGCLPLISNGYCGYTQDDASVTCSPSCVSNADCTGGTICFSLPPDACAGVISNGFCGTDAVSASETCKSTCTTNADCSGDEQCFSSPSCIIYDGYCGDDLSDAQSACKKACTSSADCKGEKQCFDTLTACDIAPPIINGYCGFTFDDASQTCSPSCTSDADCTGGTSCFGPITECPIVDGYCGTSFTNAEEECAVQCTTDADCSGGTSCFGPITDCSVSPECPEGCPNCDPDAPLQCPPQELKRVCDKHNDELFPPGDPRDGQRVANFNDCYDMCKTSFCCIHDSLSKELSPTCANKEGYENCELYYPCYIIWWKLHDTIGPATYLRLEQEEPFYDNLNFDALQQDFAQDEGFFKQLYNHHFDSQ